MEIAEVVADVVRSCRQLLRFLFQTEAAAAAAQPDKAAQQMSSVERQVTTTPENRHRPTPASAKRYVTLSTERQRARRLGPFGKDH